MSTLDQWLRYYEILHWTEILLIAGLIGGKVHAWLKSKFVRVQK